MIKRLLTLLALSLIPLSVFAEDTFIGIIFDPSQQASNKVYWGGSAPGVYTNSITVKNITITGDKPRVGWLPCGNTTLNNPYAIVIIKNLPVGSVFYYGCAWVDNYGTEARISDSQCAWIIRPRLPAPTKLTIK